jgi:hypothetical protein
MKTFYLIPLILIVTVFSAFSQTRTIVGTVTDKETSEPIPYASVLLPDHSIGVLTDVDGKFNITIPTDFDSLEIAFVGYEKKMLALLPGKDTVQVALEGSTVTLMTYEIVEDVAEISSYSKVSKKDYRSSAERSLAGYSSPVYTTSAYDDISYESASYANIITSGQLTAGEVNDFQKWKLWGDIADNELKSYRLVWSIFPKQRYLLQLENKNKMPVIDAQVILSDENGDVQWTACTDNTGKAELWASMFEENASLNNMSIKVKYQGKSYPCKKVTAFQDGVNILEIPVDCAEQKNVDIAFVIDATGSMSDELEYLKVELSDVISRVKDSLPSAKIRLAAVFYRDFGDAYVTKYNDFTENTEDMLSFFSQQSAGGGGDFPEAVDSALSVALNKLSWSSEAASRLVFMVLDAPPHSERPQVVKNLTNIIPKMAEKGIRLIPIACSGIDKSTEYFLRSSALATNGTYIFLTDDSGIGGTHLKPTTDKYDVELLNAALIRIISSFSKTEECKPLIAESFDTTKTDTAFVNMTIIDSTKTAQNDSQRTDTLQTAPTEMLAVSWKYYPNPTNGVLNIEINNLPENSEGEIYFTDITGKVLKRFTVAESKNILTDISEFPTGTYLLRVLYDKDKWLTGKVILLH